MTLHLWVPLDFTVCVFEGNNHVLASVYSPACHIPGFLGESTCWSRLKRRTQWGNLSLLPEAWRLPWEGVVGTLKWTELISMRPALWPEGSSGGHTSFEFGLRMEADGPQPGDPGL